MYFSLSNSFGSITQGTLVPSFGITYLSRGLKYQNEFLTYTP